MTAIIFYTTLLLQLDDWYVNTPVGDSAATLRYVRLAHYLLRRIRLARLSAPAVTYTPEVEFRIVDGSTKLSRFRPESDVFTAVETARRLTAAYPAFVLAWRVVRGDGVIVEQSVSERQEAA